MFNSIEVMPDLSSHLLPIMARLKLNMYPFCDTINGPGDVANVKNIKSDAIAAKTMNDAVIRNLINATNPTRTSLRLSPAGESALMSSHKKPMQPAPKSLLSACLRNPRVRPLSPEGEKSGMRSDNENATNPTRTNPSPEGRSEGVFAAVTSQNATNYKNATNPTNRSRAANTNPSVAPLYYVFIASLRGATPSLERRREGANSRLLSKNDAVPDKVENLLGVTNPTRANPSPERISEGVFAGATLQNATNYKNATNATSHTRALLLPLIFGGILSPTLISGF